MPVFAINSGELLLSNSIGWKIPKRTPIILEEGLCILQILPLPGYKLDQAIDEAIAVIAIAMKMYHILRFEIRSR